MEIFETEHGIFTNNTETNQSAQEVYEEWLLRHLKPSHQEITDAELEIKILTILMDMGVFK